MDSNERENGKEPDTQECTSIKSSNNGNKTGKKDNPYNLLNELIKGLAAICMLASILATIAMLADLYFNNAFSYFKKSFFGQTHLEIETAEHTIEQNLSAGKTTVLERPVFEIFDDEPDSKKQEHPKIKEEDHPEIKKEKPVEIKQDKKLKEEEVQNRELKVNDESKADIKNPKPNIPRVAISEKKSSIPRVAIIIDDMGFDPGMADTINRIDRNITISILPRSPSGRQIAHTLHAKGTEIMLHLPMEPLQYPLVDPGYGAILSGMTPDDIVKVLNRNLEGVPHVSGVNNHMGSRLTTLSPYMRQIFKILKERRLFFIDSLTSNHSTGRQSAEIIQIPFSSRDVFLDNNKDKAYIRKQLNELVRIAKKNGVAIAIGHPYNETCVVLNEELPALKRSVRIVSISQLVAVP